MDEGRRGSRLLAIRTKKAAIFWPLQSEIFVAPGMIRKLRFFSGAARDERSRKSAPP
jgi:hypothetical protein